MDRKGLAGDVGGKDLDSVLGSIKNAAMFLPRAVQSAYPKFKEEAEAAPKRALLQTVQYQQDNPLGSAQQAMMGGIGAVGFGAAQKAGQIFEDAARIPKFEFSDALAQIKGLPKALHEMTLDHVLEHPELFQQYPELRDVVVQKMIPTLNNAEKGGEFLKVGEKPTIRIRGNRPDADIKESLLHEVQHVIQDKEGWPLSEAEAYSRTKAVPKDWPGLAAELERLKS